MSEHAFLDETEQNGLLGVAAILAPRDLTPTRTLMHRLCPPWAGVEFTTPTGETGGNADDKR